MSISIISLIFSTHNEEVDKLNKISNEFIHISIIYFIFILISLFIHSNSLNSNSEGHPGQNNRRTDYSPDTTTKDLPYHDRGGSAGGSIPAPSGPAGQHQQQHQPSFLAYKAGEVLTTGNLTDFLKPYFPRVGEA
jgi:hypothetical protein